MDDDDDDDDDEAHRVPVMNLRFPTSVAPAARAEASTGIPTGVIMRIPSSSSLSPQQREFRGTTASCRCSPTHETRSPRPASATASAAGAAPTDQAAPAALNHLPNQAERDPLSGSRIRAEAASVLEAPQLVRREGRQMLTHDCHLAEAGSSGRVSGRASEALVTPVPHVIIIDSSDDESSRGGRSVGVAGNLMQEQRNLYAI